MISRAHRFHGYNSLRNVYRLGKVSRGPLFAIKASDNPRRQSYRLAVVVSRKVSKSAVARNRIRRRLYATTKSFEPQLAGGLDIVITVFHNTVLEIPQKQLDGQVKKQLKELNLLAK